MFAEIEKDFERISSAEFSRPVIFQLGSVSATILCIWHSTYYTLNAQGIRIQSTNPVIIMSAVSFFKEFLVDLDDENKQDVTITFDGIDYYISRIEKNGVGGFVLELKRD